jgi:hypothetical protein
MKYFFFKLTEILYYLLFLLSIKFVLICSVTPPSKLVYFPKEKKHFLNSDSFSRRRVIHLKTYHFLYPNDFIFTLSFKFKRAHYKNHKPSSTLTNRSKARKSFSRQWKKKHQSYRYQTLSLTFYKQMGLTH